MGQSQDMGQSWDNVQAILLPCISPTMGPLPINRAGYKVKLDCHLKKSLPFVSKGTMGTWKHTVLWVFPIWGHTESLPIAVVIKCFSVLVALIFIFLDKYPLDIYLDKYLFQISGKDIHYLGLCVHVCQITLVVSDSLQPHGLYPSRFLCPWDSPGKNIMGCHAFLLRIFPTQGSNPCLLCLQHSQTGILPLVPSGKPLILISLCSP